MDFEICLRAQGRDDFIGKEWMVTNGLGGYAAGTLDGRCSRRHDGILVAALDSPYGRTIMLDRLDETVVLPDGNRFALFDAISEFRLEWGLPVWRFARNGYCIERRLVMPYRQNSVHVVYRLLDGDGKLGLELKPWFHMRGNDGQLDQPMLKPMTVASESGRLEVRMGHYPPVRIALDGPDCRTTLTRGEFTDAHYPIEADRHYLADGPLWSPGALAVDLGADGAALLASTETWTIARALDPDQAFAAEIERRRRLIARADPAVHDGAAAQLVLAADSFLFQPQGRPALAAQARARGDDVASVIAGYPWFNDWGRDAMISLEGLTLVTGRTEEAKWILRTFAWYVKDGLIPANIPDGQTEGVYYACDATLWFFHAVDRYLAVTGDSETRALILPRLVDIIGHFRDGTLFNIHVDPADGLLSQGVGLPSHNMLTWMDSDSPRHGKAVEINALWYNALRVTAHWLRESGDADGAARLDADARHCRDSFNRRFWNPDTGFLFDMVELEPIPPGNPGGPKPPHHNIDPAACLPNQILALSLPHPVLDQDKWPAVVQAVRDRLLTPYGLRSLSRDAEGYCRAYAGDLHFRDHAYHRGTVWPWLLGPFVDAWLKVHPDDRAGARAFVEAILPHLRDFCVGTIAEVFDGDSPHLPRGCTAQAWSVAEVLRAWAVTAG